MKASEAKQINSEARARSSHQYTSIVNLIKTAATNGEADIAVTDGSVPDDVARILRADGFRVSYPGNRLCKIEW